MASNAKFAEIAALAGDPARANMLHALMDDRALTVTMLARVAGVSAQTASFHLAQLATAGLVTVERRGRFRYHRLASGSVARMIEGIMQLAGELDPAFARLSMSPKEAALRKARMCYDHFAGQLGVALADALVDQRFIELTNEAGVVTSPGLRFFGSIGLETTTILAQRTRHAGRVLCRACFDWSERRSHLGGALGALICSHSLKHGWARKVGEERAVVVTGKGKRIFRETFGVKIEI